MPIHELERRLKRFDDALVNQMKDIWKEENLFAIKGKKWMKLSLSLMIMSAIFIVIHLDFSFNIWVIGIYLNKDLWNLLFIAGTIFYSASYVMFSMGFSAYSTVKLSTFTPFLQQLGKGELHSRKLMHIKKDLHKETRRYFNESVAAIKKERNSEKLFKKIEVWNKYGQRIIAARKKEDANQIYINLKKLHKEITKL